MTYAEMMAELQQSNLASQQRIAGNVSMLTQMAQQQAQSQMQQIHGMPGKPAVRFAGGNTSGNGDWASKLIQYAKKQIGVDYVYGGESPKSGFDCSGLVQYAYRHMGVNLPRTAAEQGAIGHHVQDLNKLKPGDLVFYDNDSSDRAADHVAIVLKHGRILEAPRPGEQVRIAPMTYSGMGRVWGIHVSPRRF